LPAGGNRLRVAGDWAVNLVSRPIAAQVGLVAPAAARLGAEDVGRMASDGVGRDRTGPPRKVPTSARA
jgi:hypothetical protein